MDCQGHYLGRGGGLGFHGLQLPSLSTVHTLHTECNCCCLSAPSRSKGSATERDCQSLSKAEHIVVLMVRTAEGEMHAVQAVCEQESDVWLVWCFEHCCKAEHRQVYDELKDVATDTGCKFVHHKKLGGNFGVFLCLSFPHSLVESPSHK